MIWKIIFTHLQRPLDLENCPKLQPMYSMPSVSAILEPTTNQHKRINYLLPVCNVVCWQTLTGTRNTIFILQGQLPIAFGYLFRSHMLHQPFTLQHQYTHSLYCSLYISWSADKENFLNNQEPFLVCDHSLYFYNPCIWFSLDNAPSNTKLFKLLFGRVKFSCTNNS